MLKMGSNKRMNYFVLKQPVPMISLSYCIFLDILGFARDILDNSMNNGTNAKLKDFYLAFTEAKKALSSTTHWWEIKVFTDNIVLGSSLEKPGMDTEDYFALLILPVQEYQLSMVLNDYFIRGGWATGELYMDDEIVYGKSLIDAYQLESNIADVPRILFSKDMVTLIKKHLNYYSSDFSPPQKIDVLIDEDGQYFVNYLSATIIDSDNIDYDSLKKHKSVVLNRLIRHKNESKFLNKYRWVAEYHNFFCDKFLNNCPNEYFIDINNMKRNFRFIC